MPGRLIAAALRPKSPRKCREKVTELRERLTGPRRVANDHDGLTPPERAQALLSLAELCLGCDRDCPNAGARDVVPMKPRRSMP